MLILEWGCNYIKPYSLHQQQENHWVNEYQCYFKIKYTQPYHIHNQSMYRYTHTCVHVCTIRAYMYVPYVYTCMYHMCIHVCTICVYMYVPYVHTCMYHMCIHVCTIHVYMYVSYIDVSVLHILVCTEIYTFRFSWRKFFRGHSPDPQKYRAGRNHCLA